MMDECVNDLTSALAGTDIRSTECSPESHMADSGVGRDPLYGGSYASPKPGTQKILTLPVALIIDDWMTMSVSGSLAARDVI